MPLHLKNFMGLDFLPFVFLVAKIPYSFPTVTNFRTRFILSNSNDGNDAYEMK
jgi:hypothetical protein